MVFSDAPEPRIDLVFNAINNVSEVTRKIREDLEGVTVAAEKTSRKLKAIAPVASSYNLSPLLSSIQDIEKEGEKANKIITAIPFKEFRNNIGNIKSDFEDFIKSTITGITGLHSPVTLFSQSLSRISGDLPTQAISRFYKSLQKQTDELLADNVKLSTIFKGLGEIGYPAAGGVLGFGDRKAIQKDIAASLRDPINNGIKSAFKNLPGVANAIGPSLYSRGVLSQMGIFSAMPGMDKVGNLFQKGLGMARLSNTSSNASSEFGQVLTQFGLEIFGQQTEPLIDKALGSYFQFLEKGVGPRIEKIISGAVKMGFPATGENRAALQAFNQQTGGKLESALKNIVADSSQRLINRFGFNQVIPQVVNNLISYLPGLIPSIGTMNALNSVFPLLGDIYATGGDDMMFKAVGNIPGIQPAANFAASFFTERKFGELPGNKERYQALDRLRGGGIGGKLAGAAADFGLESLDWSVAEMFSRIADAAFGKQIAETLISNVLENSLGEITNYLQKFMPSWLKEAFSAVYEKLPQPMQKLGQFLSKDIAKIAGNLQNFIREQTSVYGVANNKVKNLQRKLKSLDRDYIESRTAELTAERQKIQNSIARANRLKSRTSQVYQEEIPQVGLKNLDDLVKNARTATYQNINRGFGDMTVARRRQLVATDNAKKIQDLVPQVFRDVTAGNTFGLFENRKRLEKELANARKRFVESPQRDQNLKQEIRNLETEINNLPEKAVANIVKGVKGILPNEVKSDRKVINSLTRMARESVSYAVENEFKAFVEASKILPLGMKSNQIKQELDRLNVDRIKLDQMSASQIEETRNLLQRQISTIGLGAKRAEIETKRLKQFRQEMLGNRFIRLDQRRIMEAQLLRPTLEDETRQQYLTALGRKQFGETEQRSIFQGLTKGQDSKSLTTALLNSNLGRDSGKYYQQLQQQILGAEFASASGSQSNKRQLESDIKFYKQQLEKLRNFNFQYASKTPTPLTSLVKRLRGDSELTQQEISLLSQKVGAQIDKVTANYQDGFTRTLNIGRKTMSMLPEIFQGSEIFNRLEKLNADTNGAIAQIFAQTGRTLGYSVGKGIAGGIAEGFYPVIDAVDSKITGFVKSIQKIPERYVNATKAVGDFSLALTKSIDPVGIFAEKLSQLSSYGMRLLNLGQSVFFLQQGIDIIFATLTNNPIATIIQQNTELEQQIIRIQSGLVSTNKIMDSMTQKEFTGLGAFQAIQGPVESSIEELRKRSLALANFTSEDLMEPFSIVTGMLSFINGDLEDAVDLTISFASGLSTLNLPAQQAAQEIRSILMGDISNDSLLAKTLQLTSHTLKEWRSQGKLIDNLKARLQPLVEGQFLAAQQIPGLISNMQELFQETGRISGRPIFETFRSELKELYDYLMRSQDALMRFGNIAAQEANRGFKALIDTFKQIAEVFLGDISKNTGIFAIKSIANILESVRDAVTSTLQILKPFIDAFKTLTGFAVGLGGPLIKVALQFKALQLGVSALSGGFGLLTRVLPGVGGLMGFIGLRSLPLINQFGFLTKNVGVNAAAFLTLGQNMKFIPGMTGQVNKFLGVLGPLAPALTAIIPALSGIAIKGAGLAGVFKNLGGPRLLGALTTALPGAISAMGMLGERRITQAWGKADPRLLQTLQGNIRGVTSELAKYVEATLSASTSTGALGGVAHSVAASFRGWALKTIALTGALYGLFSIFNAIASNKELVETVSSNFKSFGEAMVAFKEIATTGITGAILGITTGFTGLLVIMGRATVIAGYLESVMTNLAAVISTKLTGAIAGLSGFANFIQGVPLIGQYFANASRQAAKGMSDFQKLSQVGQVNNRFEDARKQYEAVRSDPTATREQRLEARRRAITARSELNASLAANADIMQNPVNTKALSGSSLKLRQFGKSLQGVRTQFAGSNKLAQLYGNSVGAIGDVAVRSGKRLRRFGVAGRAAFTGLGTSAKIAVLSVKAVGGAIVGLAKMVAPMLILAGAIQAVGFAWKSLAKMPRQNQELDAMEMSSEESNKIYQHYQKLIKLRQKTEERRKNGIALTDEEYEAMRKHSQVLQIETQHLKDKKEQLEEKLPEAADKSIADRIKREINLTEIEIERLEGAIEGAVDIARKDLPLIGDMMYQIKFNADLAWQGIENADGDAEQFKKNLDLVTQLNTQLYELGQISAEEAIEKITKVTKTQVENTAGQIEAAYKAILGLIDKQAAEVSDRISRRQKELEAEAATGEINKVALHARTVELQREDMRNKQRAAQRKLDEAWRMDDLKSVAKFQNEVANLENQITATVAEGTRKWYELSRADIEEDAQETLAVEKNRFEAGMAGLVNYETTKKNILSESYAKQRQLLTEQINSLNSQDIEGREKLIAEKMALYEKERQAQNHFYQALEKDLKASLDRSKVILDKDRAEGEISESGYLENELKLTDKYAQDRYNLIRKQLTGGRELSVEARKELLSDLKKIDLESIESDRKYFEARLSLIKEYGEVEKNVLAGQLATGGIASQADFLSQEFDLTKGTKNSQIGEISAELESPKISEKRRNQLRSQLSQLQQEDKQARKAFFDSRMQLLSEAQQNELKLQDVARKTNQINSAKANQKEYETTSQYLSDRLQLIKSELAKEEPLTVEEREKMQVQLAEIELEEKEARQKLFDAQLDSLTKTFEKESAIRHSAYERGKLASLNYHQETYRETAKNLSDRIKLIRDRLREETQLTSDEKRDLMAQIAQLEVERKAARQKLFDSQLNLLTKTFEKESVIRNSAYERGKLDSVNYYQETYRETAKNLSDRIKLIQDTLKKESELTSEERQSLVAQITQLEVEQKAARQKLFDAEMKLIEGFYQEASAVREEAYNYERISSIEYYQDQYNATESQLNARLEMLQERLKTETELTLEEKRELQIEISKINVELLNEEQKYFDAKIKLIETASQRETALLSSQLAKGLVSQRNYNQQTFNEDLQLINERRSLIQKRLRDTLNPETRQNLEIALAKTFEEANSAAEKYFDNSVKLLDELSNYQTMSLEKSIMSGAIGEERYESEKLQQTINSLSQRQKLVEEHYSHLAKSAENRQKLEAEITKIAQEREKAHIEYIDKTIAIAERKMQTAMDVIKLSELELQKLTRQLIASDDGTLDRNQLKRRALAEEYANTKKQLELQLRLHRDLNQIRFDDPRRQEEHQQKIRNSLKQTTELEIRLLDLQREKFEQMLDTKVAKARNEVTATVQEMEKQLNSSDFNKQVLDQQNTLLSTRQSLNDSLTSLVRSEFEIAERLEKSDRKRQQIKEAVAKYEIQALEYQQQLKQQGLEIEIRQMQIAQERAEIENEIARIRATAQIAEAQANIAKTKADPNATNEQIVAAELELQARLMEADALDRQRGLILGQRDIVGEQIKAKVIENEISNIVAKRQSQMRLIDAYDNPIIKQALSEQLKNSGALKLPQVDFNNKAITMADNIRSQFDNNSANISRQLNVDIPSQKLVTTPPNKTRLDSDRSILSSIGTQVSKIAAEIKNIGKSGVGDITINNTATAGDTQDLMAKMKNQTLKTLDGVLSKTMKMQYG